MTAFETMTRSQHAVFAHHAWTWSVSQLSAILSEACDVAKSADAVDVLRDAGRVQELVQTVAWKASFGHASSVDRDDESDRASAFSDAPLIEAVDEILSITRRHFGERFMQRLLVQGSGEQLVGEWTAAALAE